jgi:hypothetical protein
MPTIDHGPSEKPTIDHGPSTIVDGWYLGDGSQQTCDTEIKQATIKKAIPRRIFRINFD